MTKAKQLSLFDPQILAQATKDSFRKLDPRHMAKNPVMFVVEIGSVLTTILWLRVLVAARAGAPAPWFTGAVSIWLWFTVLFANFAEAVAEGRGKAQADTLRKMRSDTVARRLAMEPGEPYRANMKAHEEKVPASTLRKGDLCVVQAGELIPGDRGGRDGL